MNNYKILEWNVNLQSNTNNEIPVFVGKAIENIKADIVILTEFVFCKNAHKFLQDTFAKHGYDYYPKAKTAIYEVNEILIAWKKDKLTLGDEKTIYNEVCREDWNVPNFLTISLVTTDGEILRVAGVRITMTTENETVAKAEDRDINYEKQAKLRYSEMKKVYDELAKLTDDDSVVLIAGDFNNYRRYTRRPEWNYKKITCEREYYTSYTPKGDSYDGDGKKFPPAPEDHFITKNCCIKDYSYNRDFALFDTSIYRRGKDNFRGIDSPNPDHAMLIGTLII